MTGVPPGASPEEHNLQLEHAATIEYRHELVRKAIHLTSLSIPIVYFFISKRQALWLLVPTAVMFFLIDMARYYFQPVSDWFYRWFGWLLRRHEQDEQAKRLNGATNVLISACLCVFLFPKIITVTAFAILIISDSTSALIGRRYGKHRFLDKSLEGSAAFLLTAILVVAASPKMQSQPVEYFIGVVGAIVGTIVEAISLRIDDNISIPLAVGVVMWGLYSFLLPTVG